MPLSFFTFLWTDRLIEHLSEHGITPEEFEEVVSHPARRGQSRATKRPCCWGEARDGRYLICVYEYADDSTIVPVTAYEVEPPYRENR
jgi:hypothetical protein